MNEGFSQHCPVPRDGAADQILLAHGEGGRLSRDLITGSIFPLLGLTADSFADAAALSAGTTELAFTTDSFVVSPLFFPGGDIGTLAVFGTVNDLLVAGAEPQWLSLALILEEGLPLLVLRRVLQSIAASAEQAAVKIVAGDVKVVPRGAADGMFINTSGIGVRARRAPEGTNALQPGDRLLVSGPIGQHGVAVMSAREELDFDPPPRTDCAPLTAATRALRDAKIAVRAMRDATRGGVAAVLHEWAAASGLAMDIVEADLPLSPEVRGVCELLGLDPLHVANEGTMVVAVAEDATEAALRALRSTDVGRQAACIGRVQRRGLSPVTVRRSLSSRQPLDEPLGAPLPRIC